MPVILHEQVPHERFQGGATYQTLVGDEHGSSPIRIGIQTSPPGYRTAVHSHPYLEALTVLEGEGRAWIEGGDETIALTPGMTVVFPPNVRHWFGPSGDQTLKTLGVHASPHRIVHVAKDGNEQANGSPALPL